LGWANTIDVCRIEAANPGLTQFPLKAFPSGHLAWAMAVAGTTNSDPTITKPASLLPLMLFMGLS